MENCKSSPRGGARQKRPVLILAKERQEQGEKKGFRKGQRPIASNSARLNTLPGGSRAERGREGSLSEARKKGETTKNNHINQKKK